MMSNLTILFVLLLYSFPATSFAEEQQSIEAELRSDITSIIQKKEDSEEKTNSTEFSIQRIALGFQGIFHEKIGYRIRLALTEFLEVESESADWIEYAYIHQSFSTGLSFKIGKIFIPAGSWENDYNVVNQYFYSLTNSKLPAVYGTGLDLRFLTGEQTWAIQFVNSPLKSQEQEETTWGRNMVWYGSLFEGLLAPILTYGVFDSSQRIQQEEDFVLNTESYSVSQGGFGLRWNTVLVQAELEYNQVLEGKYSEEMLSEGQIIVDNHDEVINRGVVSSLRYRDLKKWNWFLKYTHDEIEQGKETLTTRVGWSTGLEYFPAEKENYRIHFVYIDQTLRTQGSPRENYYEFNMGVSLKLP